ncbi:MAG: molybdopterin-dependent oxidoreductase [Actinobacteria bacterium]|nr:molybdopterin-dependent oxidoreductase [Actinomycetota bacterium]
MARARARRRQLGLEGAIAAAPALAATWVAHLGSPRIPFAPTALADRLIRLTPGDVATAAIDRLHHAAQQLLAGGLVVAFLATGAIAAAAWRSSWRAALLFSAMLLGGGLADPVEPSPPRAFLGAAIGGALYGLALWALRRPREPPRVDLGRRRALIAIGASTAGLLLASGPLGQAVGWLLGRPRGLRASGLPRASGISRPPFPRIAGLVPEVTPAVEHYVVDIDINDPEIDGPSWRLEVGGLVERPLRLSFAELERLPLVEEVSVLTCISNEVGGPLVGDSRWQGVRLGELLARAAVLPSARTLLVTCADGYSAGIPLAAALHPSALVAIAQDGEALLREHGFPCRLRLPALYGMLNPKWVTSIELVDHPYRGYWAQQGWSPTAVVRTESRIETPQSVRHGEQAWIAGVAWAGIRGIRAVEVSLDEERSWQQTRLHQPLSPWAWTQWAYPWLPERPGRQTVLCRAVDGSGRVQERLRRPPHPSGASGYHRVEIAVA